MVTTQLLIVIGIVTIISMVMAYLTRGITFLSVNSDADKQVRAAAHSAHWRWPSDMHRYAEGKALMKDVGLIGLACFQRLLRDRRSEYPLTVFLLIAHAVSAVLVFLVAQSYWSAGVAWLLLALYLSSLWPYQIVLAGGYHVVAQMCLLGAVYAFQRASLATVVGSPWYLAAGLAIGCMMFASASARKFLPLAAGAFMVSQARVMAPLSLEPARWHSLTHGVGLGLVCVTAGIALSALLCVVVVRRVLGARPHLVRAVSMLSLVPVLWLLVAVALSRSPAFYLAQLWVLFGSGIVALVLLWPDLLAHIKGYMLYWDIPRTTCHFRLYRDYFARQGRPIPEHMRGAGLVWIPRFLWQVAPGHAVLALLALGQLVASAFFGVEWKMIALVLVSLSPIAIGELTGSPQLGRAYFPAFMGLLLLIGAGAARVEASLSQELQGWWWMGITVAVLLTLGWNLRVLLGDVLPARMAPARVARTLQQLGVTTLYTYRTPYNEALVDILAQTYPERYQIRFIEALADAHEGIVVVPGTSSKALTMETHRWAIEHGDFDLDAELNHLLASRQIERYAVGSFATVGTSRIWVHDCEVPSYRALILKEVGEADRWRARAWILDAQKLQAARTRPQSRQAIAVLEPVHEHA